MGLVYSSGDSSSFMSAMFSNLETLKSTVSDLKLGSQRLTAGDFDSKTEQAYAELLATLEENNLNVATPFYHVFPKNGSEYVNLYLGYYTDLASS